MMTTTRLPCALLFVLVAAGNAGASPLATFVENHCLECHHAGEKSGGLDFAALPQDFSQPEVHARWVKIYDRVRKGEMPPREITDRPAADEQAAVLARLREKLIAADRAQAADSGRATYRRLTRTELEYTLRDLFGLEGVRIKADLPPDGSAHGFNKVGEALDISHVQMARYMETADKMLDLAIATRPEAPAVFRHRLFPADQYPFFVGLSGGDCVLLKNKCRDPAFPLLDEHLPKDKVHYFIQTVLRPAQGTVGCFRHTDDSFRPGFMNFSPILPGRYRFRLSVWSFWWDQGEVKPSPRTQVVGVRNDQGVIGFFDAPSLESKEHEFEVWMEANDTLWVNTASLELVHVYNLKGRAKEYQGPGIAYDWLDVEGPLQENWPPPSHQKLFGDLPLVQLEKTDGGPMLPARKPFPKRRANSRFPSHPNQHGGVSGVWSVEAVDPVSDAEQLLGEFLPQAFRRPVSEEQLARYVALVEGRLAAGDCFEEAMRYAYKAALCSPEFLFRIEPAGKLDDWAVASRLALFLWCSLPDEELRRLAAEGKLTKNQNALKQQVRRMIEDPKANRFVEDFLGQWLLLHEIAATTPDKRLYPEFIPYMQECMLEETQAYFRHLLRHDLGVRFFIDSDFAMVNRELADLYGIEESSDGHEIARVQLPRDSHRGGLLTQGGILKVTANGTTTSPVKRGAYVLDRILGLPPDPPPPSVAAIDPDVRGATTIREQLQLHRSDPSCASCHAKIDPPGFALESFDVIGGWRQRYRARDEGEKVNRKVGEGHYGVHYRLGQPVDCTGKSAEGAEFNGIEDYKALLLGRQRQIARNFLQRLIVYATGREVRFADREAVEAILDKCENVKEQTESNFGAFRIRSMLEQLVLSDFFLKK